MEISKKKFVESLDNVGQILPEIKDAVNRGYYKVETDRLSEMSEIIRCIKIYAILKGIKKLTGRKLEVLSYYLKFGYSKKTKKDIIKGIGITDSNLNNVNCELRKLNVIHRVGYNQSGNKVNEDLSEFKRFLVNEKGLYVLINVEK